MLSSLLVACLGAANPHIAVLDIKPRVGVTTELAQGITDDVVAEVRRRVPNATVVSTEEIRSMVGFENQKQKMGCRDSSCLAEIGGALGVELVIIGTLGRFGKTYLLSLQLVETRGAKTRKQASLKLEGKSDDALLDVVSKAIEELFPAVTPPPPAALTLAPTPAPALATAAPEVYTDRPSAPPTRSHALGWTFAGVGVAAAAVAVVGGVEVLSYNSFNSQLTKGTEPAGSAAGAAVRRNQASTWGTSGIVLAAVAVGCAVGAVVTW